MAIHNQASSAEQSVPWFYQIEELTLSFAAINMFGIKPLNPFPRSNMTSSFFSNNEWLDCFR
jgi:hypothetical protein